MPLQQQIFALITSAFIFFVVIDMVRKRQLREEYSVLWLVTSVLMFVLVLRYEWLVAVTKLIGAGLPTTTLFLGSIIFLMLLAVQFCIKAVRDGFIGNVFDLDTAMGRYDGAGYRNLIKDYKGGIAYILACHLIDIVVSLMGEPEKINPYLRQTRSDGVLDNCLAVFEFRLVAFQRLEGFNVARFGRGHHIVLGIDHQVVDGLADLAGIDIGQPGAVGRSHLAANVGSAEGKRGGIFDDTNDVGRFFGRLAAL